MRYLSFLCILMWGLILQSDVHSAKIGDNEYYTVVRLEKNIYSTDIIVISKLDDSIISLKKETTIGIDYTPLPKPFTPDVKPTPTPNPTPDVPVDPPNDVQTNPGSNRPVLDWLRNRPLLRLFRGCYLEQNELFCQLENWLNSLV